jgi:hypothetical protein
MGMPSEVGYTDGRLRCPSPFVISMETIARNIRVLRNQDTPSRDEGERGRLPTPYRAMAFQIPHFAAFDHSPFPMAACDKTEGLLPSTPSTVVQTARPKRAAS